MGKITHAARGNKLTPAEYEADNAHLVDGVANVEVATTSELTTHAALTTGTHGVGASTVESTSGSQAKVDTHAGEADPHTGYRLESADHSHQSTGAQAGKLDHGLALDGLTDNDHTQYLLKQMAENDLLLLDAALSADGKYSGIAETGTLGATVAFGEIVYLDVTTSKWLLAKADVAATSKGKIGICLVAGNDTNTTTILLYGKVRADAKFPTFTIGAPVFLSAATAGLLTLTAPSGTINFVVRIVGQANTANELFFCPDNTYLELA